MRPPKGIIQTTTVTTAAMINTLLDENIFLSIAIYFLEYKLTNINRVVLIILAKI